MDVNMESMGCPCNNGTVASLCAKEDMSFSGPENITVDTPIAEQRDSSELSNTPVILTEAAKDLDTASCVPTTEPYETAFLNTTLGQSVALSITAAVNVSETLPLSVLESTSVTGSSVKSTAMFLSDVVETDTSSVVWPETVSACTDLCIDFADKAVRNGYNENESNKPNEKQDMCNNEGKSEYSPNVVTDQCKSSNSLTMVSIGEGQLTCDCCDIDGLRKTEGSSYTNSHNNLKNETLINENGLNGEHEIGKNVTKEDQCILTKPWVKMVIDKIEAQAKPSCDNSFTTINRDDSEKVGPNVDQVVISEDKQVNNGLGQIVNVSPDSGYMATYAAEIEELGLDGDVEVIAKAISDLIEYVESEAGESEATSDLDNLDSVVMYSQDAYSDDATNDLDLSDLETESQEIHVDSFMDDDFNNDFASLVSAMAKCKLSNSSARQILQEDNSGSVTVSHNAEMEVLEGGFDRNTISGDINITLTESGKTNKDESPDRTLNEEEINEDNERHVSGHESIEADVQSYFETVPVTDLDETIQNKGEQSERPQPEGFETGDIGKPFVVVNMDVHDSGVVRDAEEGVYARPEEITNNGGMSETVISPEANPDMTCMTFASGKGSVHPLLTSTPVCSVRNLVHLRQLEEANTESANPCGQREHEPVEIEYETDYTADETNYTMPNVTMVAEGKGLPLCTSTPRQKMPKPDYVVKHRNELNNISEEKLENVNKQLGDQQSESKYNCKNNENAENIIGGGEKASKKLKDKKLRKENRESKRERKKLKGTRVEKFKEYMGPGLTSSLDTENQGVINASKRDWVKDTDIEKCTLTEYKGFGLTGPMPSSIITSTPLPPRGLTTRNPNIMPTISKSGLAQLTKKPFMSESRLGFGTIQKWLSKVSLKSRPAGTEGFLPEVLTGNPARAQSNLQPQVEAGSQIFNPMHGQRIPLVPTKQLSGSNINGDQRKGTSGNGSSLKPDEAYPPKPPSKGDKSESNSNRSDNSCPKSDGYFNPKFLQSPGQLKLSAYMNFGLLTVHVVQGRQFSTKWKSSCDSFVKMQLIPDDGKKPKCKTEIIVDSNNPLYDEKFSLEVNEEDHCKRLLITVWHRDQNASVNEFLGCMSFGLRHLTNPKKEVSGWYYLLTEELGRKKHLQVSHKQKPYLKVRAHSNIPSVNKDVWGTESLYLTVSRGKHGFGFSVVEACPVRVGRVDGASPAEAAGLKPGDIIIRLNKQNVSRSTASSVAKLVKHSGNQVTMEVQRPRPVTYEHLEPEVDDITDGFHGTQTDGDHTVPQMFTLHPEEDEDKENEISVDNDTLYPINPSLASLATSTPLPLLARGHRTVMTLETRKQEAIHRLLSLELDFIDIMHAGMQRYSRPLRHCILSHTQHSALFQNIEKLTTISEYHVKQMHDNAPSSFISEDTDTSCTSDNHNFLQSIGMIYQSKVHMLCQAYELYARGISAANQALSDLRRSEDFMKFIREPQTGNQPSISTFIHRPVQHVRELYRVLQEIFLNTSQDSPDYNSLKQVVEGLQECTTNITNYSCDRVQSMSSIASRDSKASFTCSMKSQSSTASSATSSSSKGQGHQGSLQRSRSVDMDVMKIQDKLVFSPNVPVFQLCHDDRHLLFSGEMFRWEGHQWSKIFVFLFTDLLLQTVKEADGFLRVLHEPMLLRDIVGMDAQRQHGNEFVLYFNPKVLSSGHSSAKKLSMRAPSTEQKYAWKSLIEQRVFAIRGCLEYYSSSSDVSSSSASAIII